MAVTPKSLTLKKACYSQTDSLLISDSVYGRKASQPLDCTFIFQMQRAVGKHFYYSTLFLYLPGIDPLLFYTTAYGHRETQSYICRKDTAQDIFRQIQRKAG